MQVDALGYGVIGEAVTRDVKGYRSGYPSLFCDPLEVVVRDHVQTADELCNLP